MELYFVSREILSFPYYTSLKYYIIINYNAQASYQPSLDIEGGVEM